LGKASVDFGALIHEPIHEVPIFEQQVDRGSDRVIGQSHRELAHVVDGVHGERASVHDGVSGTAQPCVSSVELGTEFIEPGPYGVSIGDPFAQPMDGAALVELACELHEFVNVLEDRFEVGGSYPVAWRVWWFRLVRLDDL
jgi:hypothetical protein